MENESTQFWTGLVVFSVATLVLLWVVLPVIIWAKLRNIEHWSRVTAEALHRMAQK